VRVNHAQKLLETTPELVTDIVIRSGFASLNHFYRVFRARTGLTPRAFRLARQLTHTHRSSRGIAAKDRIGASALGGTGVDRKSSRENKIWRAVVGLTTPNGKMPSTIKCGVN